MNRSDSRTLLLESVLKKAAARPHFRCRSGRGRLTFNEFSTPGARSRVDPATLEIALDPFPNRLLGSAPLFPKFGSGLSGDSDMASEPHRELEGCLFPRHFPGDVRCQAPCPQL